jgi:hypothetical protein
MIKVDFGNSFSSKVLKVMFKIEQERVQVWTELFLTE